MDYLPPSDEQNPYAAPQSSSKPDRPTYGYLGDAPISEPNPSARVSFEIIGEAWTLFKDKMGTWVLMTLVAGIIFVAMYALMMIPFAVLGGGGGPQPGQAQQMGTAGIMFVIVFGVMLLFALVVSFLMAGMFRAAIKQVRGLPIVVGDLFQVGDVLIPVFLASILTTLATYAGSLLCIIPGLYIYARFTFTIPLVVDGRMSATQAMGLSWRALKGQVLMAFAVWFVLYLILTLGFYACLIGALFTTPLYFLSYAVMYRDFFLWKPSASNSPWIEKHSIDPEF